MKASKHDTSNGESNNTWHKSVWKQLNMTKVTDKAIKHDTSKWKKIKHDTSNGENNQNCTSNWESS